MILTKLLSATPPVPPHLQGIMRRATLSLMPLPGRPLARLVIAVIQSMGNLSVRQDTVSRRTIMGQTRSKMIIIIRSLRISYLAAISPFGTPRKR